MHRLHQKNLETTYKSALGMPIADARVFIPPTRPSTKKYVEEGVVNDINVTLSFTINGINALVLHWWRVVHLGNKAVNREDASFSKI